MNSIGSKKHQRQKILIVDDSEMNRSILMDILEEEYTIIEAENGVEAVSIMQKMASEISIVLLDIVMPEMDGYGVLEAMNENDWIGHVPVIMISAENDSSRVDQAYDMGATDFISRPFDARVVRRRVVNTILLYAKQKKLENLAADQIYEKEQRSGLLIDILSHIVEFRNGESGWHVIHVRMITDMLLKRLVQKTNMYKLSQDDISAISVASALHDIGKISIDEKILNKPGRLTNEEYEIMKTHSMVGAKMLEDLPIHQNEPLVKTAYEICRWHHERYDGRGYPDGLKGEEIPISAQAVAMADVYDALTSKRVYKDAFSHEKAISMIMNGECGVFNPIMVECLCDISGKIVKNMKNSKANEINQRELENVAREMNKHRELSASSRTLQLLEKERMKYSFFAAMSDEIQFEYSESPSMIILNSWGADKLGMPETIMDPMQNEKLNEKIGEEAWNDFSCLIKGTTPENPIVTHDIKLKYNGEPRWFRVIARALWSSDEPPKFTGCIGKIIDIHNSRTKLESLERMASYDALTDLVNYASAKRQIEERLKDMGSFKSALAIFDLDHFKLANDNYGHLFGNEVLVHVAEKLRKNVRRGDIAARIGGDEFLLFFEYKQDLEPIIKRIFSAVSGEDYKGFKISASMGIAETSVVGPEYEKLFKAADKALYSVKYSGKGRYCFYDKAMEDLKLEDDCSK